MTKMISGKSKTKYGTHKRIVKPSDREYISGGFYNGNLMFGRDCVNYDAILYFT